MTILHANLLVDSLQPLRRSAHLRKAMKMRATAAVRCGAVQRQCVHGATDRSRVSIGASSDAEEKDKRIADLEREVASSSENRRLDSAMKTVKGASLILAMPTWHRTLRLNVTATWQ